MVLQILSVQEIMLQEIQIQFLMVLYAILQQLLMVREIYNMAEIIYIQQIHRIHFYLVAELPLLLKNFNFYLDRELTEQI